MADFGSDCPDRGVVDKGFVAVNDELRYKPGDLLVYEAAGYGIGCAGVVDKGFVAEDGQAYYWMTSGDLIPESSVIRRAYTAGV